MTMKKNLFKRIGAIALAVAVSLTMGTAAFAASNIDGTTKVGAEGTSVTFTDTFKASQGDKAQNLPAATFDYSIAAGQGKAATSSTPLIKAGVGSPTITDAAHSATEAGTTTNSVDVTVNFGNVSFTAAGIYRYVITEDSDVTSSVKDDIAIDTTNQKTKGTLYLDVYVKKTVTASGTTYTPFAYVLMTDAEAPTLSDTNNNNLNDTATYSSKIDTVTNEYTTYDLTVSKTIVGDMAADNFDFTIAISELPTGVYIKKDSDTAVTGASKSFTQTLANGGTTTIYGLPSTAKYAIREAVNKDEGYAVEVTGTNATYETYDWIGTEAYGNETPATMGKNDITSAFTNTLESISPTNVIMRYAPYLFILAAAIVLLLVMRRRKAHDAE